MKKLAILLISALAAFCLTACGDSSDGDSASDADQASQDQIITIDVPASFIEHIGQDNLNSLMGEDAQQYVTANEDGSMQLTFTRTQYAYFLEELKNNINNALASMANSTNYPNIKEIEANDDFTDFDVYMKSDSIGASDSMIHLVLYLYGKIFTTFAPDPNVTNIHVDFINSETGEVTRSTDSKDLGKEE